MYYIIVQCNHKRPGFHVIGTYPLSDIEEENARLEAELAHLRLSAPPTMPRLPPTTPVALGNVNTLPGLHQELRELQEQVDALRGNRLSLPLSVSVQPLAHAWSLSDQEDALERVEIPLPQPALRVC